MTHETIITVVGNLTADPELRFTPNGAAVSNFTIASTPRKFDKQTNEFKDQETLFLRCSIWREAAENVAESLGKSMRVIATGVLRQRSFEDKEGNKRTSIELDVQEIGPALRFATAQVTRNQRSQGGQSAGQNAPQGQDWGNAQNPPQRPAQGQQADPWNGGRQQSADWGNPNQDQKPPF